MNCPECSAPIEFRAPRCGACGSSLHLTNVTTVSGHPPRLDDPSLEFPPGALIAERFTILKEPMRGGMGTVYKSFDNALDQEVALKLIRSDLADDALFSERFKQEVKLTRQVSHPNVCRVHDLGESHGLLFLTMEWLDGEKLSDIVAREKALPLERALEIAQEIGLALEAAHRRGIVHRDLKPQNVMIGPQGSVHVMDFGIAVGPGVAAGPPSGTPTYMSPEQWRGEAIDARSDLYSLGLIFQEMLGGQSSLPDARVRATLPIPARRKAEPILDSLMAEDKEARCPSAGEAVELFRAARGARWLDRRRSRRRVAWLTGSAVMIGALTYTLWPKPVGGPSLYHEKAHEASAGWGFYERGRQYLLLEDSVGAINDAIHMLNRAVEADPRLTVAWARLSEAYWLLFQETRRESSRDEAKRTLAKAVHLDAALPEVQYTRGRGLLAEKKYKEAREVLEPVVREAPGMDLAWANLGPVYRELGNYDQARRAIETAIRLNPPYFRHQVYLGLLLYKFGEFDRSVAAYRKATELNPASFSAWNGLATNYLSMHRFVDAQSAATKAIQCDDENATGYSNLGTAYYFQNKLEDAAKSYARATDLDPGVADGWGNLGDALTMLKREQEARTAYARAVEAARLQALQVPTDPRAHIMLALYCARVREKECAFRESGQAARMQPDSLEILFRSAVVYCIFGEMDEALDWLEKAVKLGLSKSEIENDPDLVPLHGNPRYQRILDLAR